MEEGLANQAEAEARFARELERASALKVRDLAIGGKDVMEALAICPSPRVGQVLAGLLDRVLEEPSLNTRQGLLNLLPEVVREISTVRPQEAVPSEGGVDQSPGRGTRS